MTTGIPVHADDDETPETLVAREVIHCIEVAQDEGATGKFYPLTPFFESVDGAPDLIEDEATMLIRFSPKGRVNA